MQKEIHFYESEEYNVIHSWKVAEFLIQRNAKHIHTSQMGCLLYANKLFEDGYKIFIHEEDGSVYEIKLGDGNERTSRQLQIAHNFFKLWLNGEFKKKQQS